MKRSKFTDEQILKIVREGETGLTAPPEDPLALADTIVRFFEQGLGPGMAPHIARLQVDHSWGQLAEQTVDLIAELAPGRGWA